MFRYINHSEKWGKDVQTAAYNGACTVPVYDIVIV